MRLCITGFLADERDDDSIQYELLVSPEDEHAVLAVLGWESLPAESDGELLLTSDQIDELTAAINKPMPRDLDVFVGVIS